MDSETVNCPKCDDDNQVGQYHLDGDVMHIWCDEHGYVIVSGWSDRFKAPEAEW